MVSKYKRVLFLLILIIVSITVIISGCGSSIKGRTEEAVAYDSAGAVGSNDQSMNTTSTESEKMEESKEDNGSGAAINPVIGDRKIIFNANMTLEVEDFDEAFNDIKMMVEGTNSGYIQNSNIRTNKISSKPEVIRKEGTVVLRVAQSKFSSILSQIGNLGTVTHTNTATEEVTDRYYDTKYRAEMYEEERDRIMEYLKEAEDLETMLVLERKLSEITYEIEKLKGTLRHLDNLVEFSTITVEIIEKSPDGVVYNSFNHRISETFKRSILNIINALSDLIVGLIRIIPVLVVLFVLYLIGKPLVKMIIKKVKAKKDNL